MSDQSETSPATPPNQALGPEAIARYLKGAPPETSQYEFFIGNWDCALRIHPSIDGQPLELRAVWNARWAHERRILVDDLSVYSPSGEEILGWLNLRTYSEETACWAISGHRALAPASGAITHGHWRAGEMHLDFETEHAGQQVRHAVRFHDITPQSFEWEWRQRDQSGTDWRLFATLSARRAAVPAQRCRFRNEPSFSIASRLSGTCGASD